FNHSVATSLGVNAAGVGDYLDVALDKIGKYRRDHDDEVSRVPRPRITSSLLLHDRHRDLGEIIKRQVVDGASAHLFYRSFKRVSPEALSVCDSDCLHDDRC